MFKDQANFAIIPEMLETVEVIRNFDDKKALACLSKILDKKSFFMTGEGSSRVFPAKSAISYAHASGVDRAFHTEGCFQASEYSLNRWAMLGASNSGKTKELVKLFEKLGGAGSSTVAMTAHQGTPLEKVSGATFHLGCGKENAVAATKSVIEQALFYEVLIRQLSGKGGMDQLKSTLVEAGEKVLSSDIDSDLVKKAASASKIYFSGRNNGVAEELTLKTNEITRKASAYLEGTYAVHGIEEVMREDELVVVINPFESEEEKFDEVLQKGVGLNIIAISHRETRFPTIRIPDVSEGSPYLQLMAGWNLLIHIGLEIGIDMDNPLRARKVGNSV